MIALIEYHSHNCLSTLGTPIEDFNNQKNVMIIIIITTVIIELVTLAG